MDKNIRVRGRISGDDDVEGHAHKRAAADAVKRVITKARKRETDDDTEGHARKRVKLQASPARKRATDDKDTEGHARKRANLKAAAAANAAAAKKR